MYLYWLSATALMGSRAKYQRKKQAKKEAKKKFPALFTRAQEHPEQRVGDRLIRRARRLAMKFRMSLNPHRHQFCKHCYVRLKPGENCRVRIHNSKVIYTCFACKKHRRVHLK